MAFDFSTLITDRSPEDLQALRDLLATPMSDWTAEQLAEFNRAASKGAYNYTDLNRVIAAMDDINERLTAAGYVTGYQRIEVPHQGGGRLPDGYTELEYIESTGTQYIDTGVYPNGKTRITMSCIFNVQENAAWLFGARAGTYVNTFNFLTTNGSYRSDYGNGAGGNPFSLQSGEFNLDKNGPDTYVDTVLKDHGNQQDFTSSFSLYLFANNSSGSAQGRGIARISSVEIYDGEDIVREYIPCTSVDGKVGFYDLENDQFYGNAGSGEFLAGPVASLSINPDKDLYIWYEDDTPSETVMKQYLSNVDILRNTLTLPEDTPKTPLNMKGLTINGANTIEEVLDVINIYLMALQSIFRRCGAVVCGGPELYFVN